MLVSPDILSPRDLKRIGDAIYQHCGINLHDGKQELVHARLAKLLRHSSFRNAREYLDHTLGDPGGSDFSELVDALSTNLTSFFRESDHFTFLAREFLPERLAAMSKIGKSTLRGWSAACSTGEEPYSIAMIVAESLAEHAPNLPARILATDISHRVLEQARRGVYDRTRTAPIPPLLRSRYMTPSPAGRDALEPVPALRDLVRFAYLNLLEPWPFAGPFDFIFCRNVMIYFDKPTQQALIARFYDLLDSGGILFTGHSESLTGITHRFAYVQPTIYRKP